MSSRAVLGAIVVLVGVVVGGCGAPVPTTEVRNAGSIALDQVTLGFDHAGPNAVVESDVDFGDLAPGTTSPAKAIPNGGADIGCIVLTVTVDGVRANDRAPGILCTNKTFHPTVHTWVVAGTGPGKFTETRPTNP